MKSVFSRTLLAAVLIVTAGAAVPVLAQVQFPSNPTDAGQCENAYERGKALAQQYADRANQYSEQRQATYTQGRQACAAARDWSRCYAPYGARYDQYYELSRQAFAERDRITRAADAGNRQCVQIVRAHEQQLDEQRRIAQENQRRQQQANAENERRQQQAQAESERARREYEQAQNQAAMQQRAQAERQQREYQAQVQRQQQAIAQQQQAQQTQQAQAEQQRRDYAARQMADIQRVQAQQAREESRQPRVVGVIEPSPFSPATRNEPRYVQTPETIAQARAESQAAQNYQNLQTGKTLRDLYDAAVDAGNARDNGGVDLGTGSKYAGRAQDAAVQTFLDRQLNPQGYKDPGIDTAVLVAREENREVNRARVYGSVGSGDSAVITRISNTSIGAIGSSFNDTVGQGTRALDELSAPAASSGYSSPASAPIYVPASEPRVTSSLDELAAAPVPSPADACKNISTPFARDQCVVDQCKLTQFKTHQICRSLTP